MNRDEIASLWPVPFPLQSKRSFDSRVNRLGDVDGESSWNVVSPMTHHVIREPSSPTRRLRRNRSRSFNDYIDASRYAPAQYELLVPPLRESANETTKLVPDGFPKQEATNETSKKKEEEEDNPIWMCVMYGMINAAIVVPVLMSFGRIIYQNPAFIPYMPVLIKLALVSGVVHQLCFSGLSSLPFAVGQVQDAGLIFLSSMATRMVDFCHERGHNDEILLATVTICLSICTTLLGVAVIIIGRLRLAGYVQMLPTCVVGGYLAFIGWFCGVSGFGIMVEPDVSLLENFQLTAPGLLGGIMIYCLVRTLRHVAVLPASIVVLLALFYVVLGITDTTVEEATENGWIRESEEAPVWYHTWDFLKFNKVDWHALPQLVLSELSMIIVVALSSSLDVAAIELELGEPLNYNAELTMVGVSNFISGLTGGYTGSYIFSQSIFSLRAGIRSRLAGCVLALVEALIIVAPFPILSYVPNFFYGAMLTMICVDLMYDWLWEIRLKVTQAEHVICLLTFGITVLWNVELGILCGIIIYVACLKLNIDVGEVKVMNQESQADSSEPTSQNEHDKIASQAGYAGEGPTF